MKIKVNLKSLRKKSPLVHIISNSVSSARVADFSLSVGASPMMAEYSEEVSEITKKAHALVLNMGMLNEDKIKAIKISAKIANEEKIPIVFDPVGVASSKTRRDLAKFLLENFKFNIIRGNFNEINYLVNGELFTGVNSDDDNFSKDDFINLAVQLNKKTNATVVISGKYEIIANSHMVISVAGGNENLKKTVGIGDMESAMIGCLLAYPLSDLKAAAISSIYLRQTTKKFIKDKNLNSINLINALKNIEEIIGEIEILKPAYKFEESLLYGISDGGDISKIKKAVGAGMSIYQLRDKISDEKNLSKKIDAVKSEIEDKCLFILNDNLKLAKKYDLAVHLGQNDEKISKAREALGRDKIIGASAKNSETAIASENMGASYIGTGAFFETETKKDATKITLDAYKEIKNSVLIPVFPIGGINLKNLDFFKGLKLDGVCMSGGIFSSDEENIENEVGKILKKLKNLKK